MYDSDVVGRYLEVVSLSSLLPNAILDTAMVVYVSVVEVDYTVVEMLLRHSSWSISSLCLKMINTSATGNCNRMMIDFFSNTHSTAMMT